MGEDNGNINLGKKRPGFNLRNAGNSVSFLL
jgi:hypothetical protein